MHLADLLAHRTVPAAGLYLAITRRCPLSCRHCSTSSGPRSAEQPVEPLLRLVRGFTPTDRPRFLLLTGGEPLSRPEAVHALATTARVAGTRTYLLTGAFFADRRTVPAPIAAAVAAVDHVAVSLDAFHDEQVPRADVLRFLHRTLSAGTDVSVQACGTGPDDPYLAALEAQVRREFGDRVPLFVTTLAGVGRARSLPAFRNPVGPVESAGPVGPVGDDAAGDASPPPAVPCEVVSWPVVGFDGRVVACCNPDVLTGGRAPAHLDLGPVDALDWPRLRRAVTESATLRALRTRGPLRLAHGASGTPGSDYCGTCRALTPDTLARSVVPAPVTTLLERQTEAWQRRTGPRGFARRHGDPSRADLVLLGGPPSATGAVPCPG
jgi:hypothetical protein